MDKEHELRFACDDLQREISMIEFRHSMKKSA
jgi:hypothetical protein